MKTKYKVLYDGNKFFPQYKDANMKDYDYFHIGLTNANLFYQSEKTAKDFIKYVAPEIELLNT